MSFWSYITGSSDSTASPPAGPAATPAFSETQESSPSPPTRPTRAEPSSSSSLPSRFPRSDSGTVRDTPPPPPRPSTSTSSRYGRNRNHGYNDNDKVDDNRARQDLFNGANYDPHARQSHRQPHSSNSHSTYSSRRRHPQEEQGIFYSQQDEEDAYQDTVQQIGRVKEQSVDTSRSALRRLRETEEVAASSMRRLQEQSDKLAQVESRMTDADYHAHRAENKTQELQKLNKNFIVSSFSVSNPFTKSKRREAKLQRELDERKQVEEEQLAQRREARNHNRTIDNTLEQVQGRHVPGQYYDANSSSSFNHGNTPSTSRSRTHYLEGEEDCEQEREIDNNLNEISGALSRLKVMGMAMGDAIERSNQQVDRIDRRTDKVNDRVKRTEAKLGRIK